MAEAPSVADQALKKLANQLTCSVCLDTYTTPKLLQCFHVFCEECLQKLVHRGQPGTLTCPICCKATQIPPNGIPALQTAFHIHYLFEIKDVLEKTQSPQHVHCEKCKGESATSYCSDCGKFICKTCSEIHEKWEELSSHEVISLDQLVGDVTKLVPPKRAVSYCPKHKGKELELYCDTCEELICHNCIVRLHLGHQYNLVTDALPKHKDKLVVSLKPVKQQLGAVEKAINRLDARCQQISNRRTAIETKIRQTIREIHEVFEVRKTELIWQLDQMTQQKLKSLAAQRDQFELLQTQLSSCLDFVNKSLRTGSEGEVLGMKTPVVKQIEELTAEFQPEDLVPKEQADLKFFCYQEYRIACQEFFEICACPVSPANCYVTGSGMTVANVGEEATAILHAMVTTDQECKKPVENISCKLVSSQEASTVKCSVKKREKNKYEIRYKPATRGQHRLHVKVEGVYVRDSPFPVVVKIPVEKLGVHTRIISGLDRPWGVAVNERGEIVVTENKGHCVSILNQQRIKLQVFGSKGSAPGQFNHPAGVAIAADGSILVADCDNNRVQKFSSNGKLVTSVGMKGSGALQFKGPTGIAIETSQDSLVYVCDCWNHRIQVLNSDLTLVHRSFGIHGRGRGQFNQPHDVALDSRGNVYVADFKNHRIQVFTREGKHFLRSFGENGSDQFLGPASIFVNSDDKMVFVGDIKGHCVSAFTCEGQFVKNFATWGAESGEGFNPCGMTMDTQGFLYVCDCDNNKLQIF